MTIAPETEETMGWGIIVIVLFVLLYALTRTRAAPRP
jgi:hypothetical protein